MLEKKFLGSEKEIDLTPPNASSAPNAAETIGSSGTFQTGSLHNGVILQWLLTCPEYSVAIYPQDECRPRRLTFTTNN